MEIRILGPLEVEGEQGPIELTRERERALVGLLALSPGKPVASDHLINEIWPEAPAEAARHSLHVLISRIRRSLGDGVLLTKRPGYVIQAAEEDVDLFRFQRLVKEGDLALDDSNHDAAVGLLRTALAMWRGPPDLALTGLASGPAHTSHLEELKLSTLESLFEAELAMGHHGQVVDELTTAVEEHPFRERLWEQLMLALYRSGRQADALAAFSKIRALLADELGIEPGPRLRQLEDEINLQKPKLDWRKPPPRIIPTRHLPAQSTSFVGRSEELVEVDKLLRGSRLVTLTGPGGSGKSRLALKTAQRSIDRFPEGVWAVELASVAEAESVADAIAQTLRVRQRPGQDLLDTLSAFMENRNLLLVLDNCEHILDQVAPAVHTLLTAAPGLTVMATSRQPLRLIGETLYRVAPMAIPDPAEEDARVLARHDSVRLFAARAEATEPGFRLTPITVPRVAEICRRVDGLPLAIELVVGRLPGMGLEELTARLKDPEVLLGTGARGTDTRHRSVRDALDWSYQLLSDTEQEALRRNGIFQGGFDLAAFQAVVVWVETPEKATEVLAGLVDRSLLSREGDRWKVLETVRHYALERLEEAGELEEVRRRHLEYFIDVAERADARIRAGDDLGHLPVVEADYPNTRSALRYALQNGRGPEMAWAALRIVGGLYWFWIMRGQWSESLGWIRQALEITPDRPSEVRARALLALAGLAGQAGLFEEAQEAAGRAREISHEEGFDYGIAMASSIEAVTWAWQGDLKNAHATFDRWQNELIGRGGPMAEAMLLFNRGWVLSMAGESQEARHLLEKSMTLTRQRGFAFGTACAAMELARLARLEGDLDRCEGLANEAIDLLSALGSGWWIGAQLHYDLGSVARARGELDVAAERFGEGLDMATRYGNPPLTAQLLDGRAGLLGDLGEFESAACLLGAAESIREMIGVPPLPSVLPQLEADVRTVRKALGEKQFGEARNAGAKLSPDQAVAVATRTR